MMRVSPARLMVIHPRAYKGGLANVQGSSGPGKSEEMMVRGVTRSWNIAGVIGDEELVGRWGLAAESNALIQRA